MHSEHYKIKLDGFEGPFDLLLDLIEKRKLHINDISLSKVTDDYISHVKSIQHFPIALSANFILIASTLLLIKSKSLLPALQLTEEEQMSIEDLENRLIGYFLHLQIFSSLSLLRKTNLHCRKNNSIYSEVCSVGAVQINVLLTPGR